MSTKKKAQPTNNKVQNKTIVIAPEKNNSWNIKELIAKYQNYIFYAIFLLAIFFSWRIFDPRIALMGDDSAYVMRANEFLKNKTFPGFQGPFFPLVLSLIIKLKGGIDIQSLKLVSYFSYLFSLPLFYFGLKKILQPIILLPFIFLYALSNTLLFYSSYLLSEAFYLFLESLLIFVFVRFVLTESPKKYSNIIFSFLAGVIIYLLGITRNIGIISLPLLLIPLIYLRRYKLSAYVFIGFLLAYGIFWAFKSGYNIPQADSDSQLKMLLNKNPYSESEGKETITGFVQRFWDNSNQYLSQHLINNFGLRKPIDDGMQMTNITFVTILLYILMFFGWYKAWKNKDSFWLTNYFFAFGLSASSFIILQTMWNQDRLILIFLPFWILGLLYALYQLKFTFLKSSALYIYVIIFMIFGFTTFNKSSNTMSEMQSIREEYDEGNRYAGFDIAWVNYLQLCEWSSKNVNTKELIAVRKPEMGYIVSNGYNFYGLYKSPEKNQNADSIIQFFKKNNIRYIVQDFIFGTTSNYLKLINDAYPTMIQPIKKIGDEKSKPATLYQIKY